PGGRDAQRGRHSGRSVAGELRIVRRPRTPQPPRARDHGGARRRGLVPGRTAPAWRREGRRPGPPPRPLGFVVMGGPAGEALFRGERLRAGDAMARAEIPRLTLGAKDGLAITNG